MRRKNVELPWLFRMGGTFHRNPVAAARLRHMLVNLHTNLKIQHHPSPIPITTQIIQKSKNLPFHLHFFNLTPSKHLIVYHIVKLPISPTFLPPQTPIFNHPNFPKSQFISPLNIKISHINPTQINPH